jgi:hypothetical protein
MPGWRELQANDDPLVGVGANHFFGKVRRQEGKLPDALPAVGLPGEIHNGARLHIGTAMSVTGPAGDANNWVV